MHTRPSSGARRESEGVEVVLVETDDWAEVAASVTGTTDGVTPDAGAATGVLDEVGPAPRQARHRRGWYAWRSALAAAVALLLVVVLNVVEAQRHEARIAALGDLAGFLAPQPTAPVETWRVTGRVMGQAGGLVLVSDMAQGQVRAVDPRTGTSRWTLTGEVGSGSARGYCGPVDEAIVAAAAAADPLPAPRASDPGVIACLGDPLPPPEGPATSTTVVWFVDAQTGQQVGSHTVEGSLVLADAVERDLVVGSVLPDGRLNVVRLDPGTGESRWDYTSPDAMFGRDPLMIQSLDRRGDALVVGALSGELAVSLTTGAPLHPEDVAHEPAVRDVTHLSDGGTAIWQPRPDGTSGTGRVVDVLGRRAFGLTGPVRRAATRDDSLPQTLVVSSAAGNRLRGVSLQTGRQLWSTETGRASTLVQVLGVMVLGEQDSLAALDLRDGSVLWTVARDPAVRSPGLTDGELVLVAQPAQDGPVLSARTLSDGAEVWRAALPQGTTAVLPIGGRLVAQTSDAVVGLS